MEQGQGGAHKEVPVTSGFAKQPRVLHVLRAPVGGLFRHVCDLARAQSDAGYEIGILCADEPNDEATVLQLSKLAEHCSLGVGRISLGRFPGISDLRALAACARQVKIFHPDIVHGHGAKGGLLARLVPARKAITRVYTPHGGSIHYAPGSVAGILFGAAERVMLHWTDGLIFESCFAQSIFSSRFGSLPSVTSVVHNGLGEEEFDEIPFSPGHADFVFLGEIRALKGVFTLVEALASVATEHAVSLAIVGDGPEVDALAVRIAALNLSSHVRFLGRLPARTAFAEGRMVVMPSHHDSFPYVALEAAAAGRPLLATRTGGIPEIFGPYEVRLVSPQDANALATRMAAFLKDPSSEIKAAAFLKERVRAQFSATDMAAGVANVYRRAMASKARLSGSDTAELNVRIKMDAMK